MYSAGSTYEPPPAMFLRPTELTHGRRGADRGPAGQAGGRIALLHELMGRVHARTGASRRRNPAASRSNPPARPTPHSSATPSSRPPVPSTSPPATSPAILRRRGRFERPRLGRGLGRRPRLDRLRPAAQRLPDGRPHPPRHRVRRHQHNAPCAWFPQRPNPSRKHSRSSRSSAQSTSFSRGGEGEPLR